jgi:hypothetical protein
VKQASGASSRNQPIITLSKPPPLIFIKMKYQKNNLSNLFAIPLIALGTFSCEMNPMEEPFLSDQLQNVSHVLGATEGANMRAGGSILYEETFEGSNPFSTAHGLETGASHSVTYVNRPDNSGNKTSRFELRDNDPDVKGSRRAEVTIVKGEDGDIAKEPGMHLNFMSQVITSMRTMMRSSTNGIRMEMPPHP